MPHSYALSVPGRRGAHRRRGEGEKVFQTTSATSVISLAFRSERLSAVQARRQIGGSASGPTSVGSLLCCYRAWSWLAPAIANPLGQADPSFRFFRRRPCQLTIRSLANHTCSDCSYAYLPGWCKR